MNSILRERTVKYIVARQLEEGSRVNISGVAAMTGISRSEISRILKVTPSSARQSASRRESPVNGVLTAWRQDPRFMTSNGRPKGLRVFGRGTTFESLVRTYGRGIPVRAFFDELTRAGAIEMRASKVIFPRKTWEIDRRNAVKKVNAIGDAVNNLVSSVLKGMRHPDGFDIADRNQRVWSGAASLVQVKDLFSELHHLLMRYQATSSVSRKSPNAAAWRVSIVLSEVPERTVKRSTLSRRNFRRNT